MNLRLPEKIVIKIEEEATLQLRSLNSMFEVIATEWVAKRPKSLGTKTKDRQ